MKLEGNSSHEDDGNGILLQSRKNSVVRLQIVPAKQKTITHLPKRPPVDLAFTDLTYKVREGRKSSKYQSFFLLQLTWGSAYFDKSIITLTQSLVPLPFHLIYRKINNSIHSKLANVAQQIVFIYLISIYFFFLLFTLTLFSNSWRLSPKR